MVHGQAMKVLHDLLHKSDQQLRGFVMTVLSKSMALLGCLATMMLELMRVFAPTILIDSHDDFFFCDVQAWLVTQLLLSFIGIQLEDLLPHVPSRLLHV
jgi:hypothetical protein